MTQYFRYTKETLEARKVFVTAQETMKMLVATETTGETLGIEQDIRKTLVTTQNTMNTIGTTQGARKLLGTIQETSETLAITQVTRKVLGTNQEISKTLGTTREPVKILSSAITHLVTTIQVLIIKQFSKQACISSKLCILIVNLL